MLRTLSAAATAALLAVLGFALATSPATAELNTTASTGWAADDGKTKSPSPTKTKTMSPSGNVMPRSS